jgi:serine/threonine protein phosphatase PrpC
MAIPDVGSKITGSTFPETETLGAAARSTVPPSKAQEHVMDTVSVRSAPSAGPEDARGCSSSLLVTAFGQSDAGRIRPSNEDHFLIAEMRKAMRILHSNLPQPTNRYSDECSYLMVVADGMGGSLAGERASAVAVDSIEDFCVNTLKWFFHLRGHEEGNVLNEFQTALRQADVRVLEEAEKDPETFRMGTTLTMGYALNSDLYVAHVGDSRCYLFRSGDLRQITRDHTVVAELVRQGTLTDKQASQHPLRHLITNVIGGGTPGIRIEAHKLPLEPHDVVLLCTDGLGHALADDQVAAILATERTPQDACRQLISTANDAGTPDNVSVIVASFESRPQ